MAHLDYSVLIADEDGHINRNFAGYLRERGFEVHVATNAGEAKNKILEVKPRFVFSDLVMPDLSALELMDFIKSEKELEGFEINVMVTSRHNNEVNVKNCLNSGVKDYIIKPFKFEDVFSRIIFHAQKKRNIPIVEKENSSELEGGDLYLHLVAYVLKEATSNKDSHTILHNMTRMLAMSLKAVRCNLMECSSNRQDCWIRAASDDPSLRDLNLDLNRYSEVLHVMNTEEPVVVEDLDKDSQLIYIKRQFKNISFNSLIVCPVFRRREFFGVISTRMADSKKFSDKEIRFAMMMSQVVSLLLSAQLDLPLEMQKPA